MCSHVRMLEKPPKGAVLCYPNIALIEALVCNPLVHRILCRSGQSEAMLGCTMRTTFLLEGADDMPKPSPPSSAVGGSLKRLAHAGHPIRPPSSAGEPKMSERVHLRRRCRRWGEAPPVRDPCRATARLPSSILLPQVNGKCGKWFTCAGGRGRGLRSVRYGSRWNSSEESCVMS